MTTPQDCSLGIATEATYGTAATPSRWFEFNDETFTFNKMVKQGAGLRVGSRVARSNRRMVPTADANGTITLEAFSKGLGLLLAAAVGSGTSTLVGAGVYQQVFTLADVPPSLTIQKGVPRVDGTIDALTFTGCMVDQLELTCDNAAPVQVKTTFDCKDVTSAQAYAAPSYPTTGALFHFTHGALYTGAFTAPTATALAAAGTPLANVRSWSVALNHNLTKDRFNFGGGGRKDKPTVGTRGITGKLGTEYAGTLFRDAVLNDTPMTLLLSLTNGADVLQVAVPEIRVDGDLPQSNGGDLVMQDVNFTGLDGLTQAQPFWVVQRTTDTAL